ncbi:MAG: carbamoyltransferase HypF [Desulfurococcales archaeon]|nr:carbamoyltransferase HypF [Desulfurococcales archaeon]
MVIAVKLIITGLVQGVGFRPFIHRLATSLRLRGYVRNVGGSEVEVYLEGRRDSIKEFLRRLYEEKPPPAIIENVEIYSVEPMGCRDFVILKSSINPIKRSMIPPDFAICRYCLAEILDPDNRRYRYAFNSCAWCGPRFSMMYKVPYDRENTSMKKYSLCSKCLQEYTDINNIRRYHAQGISCLDDGPRLKLTDKDGEEIDVGDPITYAAKLIDEGHIVAIKGLGGYHIAALSTDDDVVLRLRKRKQRPQKPFAIMVLTTSVAEKLVYIDDVSRKILESPKTPIVLLPKRDDSPVSKYVSPGLDKEGVFLAYTGLHYLLLSETRDKFLIMTSGNRKGKPMCITEECAYKMLSSIVDYYLVHDREIVNRVDDSVVRFTNKRPVLLRRGRSYTPLWIRLPFRLDREYIAFGADIHNAGAIGFDDKIVLTQYIGDLSDLDVLSDLDKYLEFFIRNYRINPYNAIYVADKHPGYLSRYLALKYSREYQGVFEEIQHHYAHLLATAIDNGLYGEFLGIAIDGIGLGDDNAIWGGEVFYINMLDGVYERIGHLEYQPYVGEQTTFYPARYLVTILTKIMGYEELTRFIKRSGLEDKVPGGIREYEMLYAMVKRNKYISSSSTGRLLDAVASLLGVCYYRSYEGEPAIKLESFARNGVLLDDITYSIRTDNNNYVVDTTALIMQLIDNMDFRDKASLAKTVQIIIGEALADIVVNYLKGRRNIQPYILVGGGASVNDYIIHGIERKLNNYGLELYLPRSIPANDGGIAVGQIVAAFLKNNINV